MAVLQQVFNIILLAHPPVNFRLVFRKYFYKCGGPAATTNYRNFFQFELYFKNKMPAGNGSPAGFQPF
jgi:hypothetical protein